MPKYQACIFDLDGVLVNTADFHFRAWKRLADHLGIPFDEEDNEKLKGVTREKSLDLLLSRSQDNFDQATRKQLSDQKNQWYMELIHTLTPKNVLPGTIKLLETLQSHHIKRGVASASKNARAVLSSLELTKHFQAIVDGNQVGAGKPNPEVFLQCAASLGIPPQQCIVFEDAQAGIEGAQAAGMYAIAVGDRDDMPSASRFISSLADLDFQQLRLLINGSEV